MYSTIRGQKFITHREASVSQVVLPWGDNEIMCFASANTHMSLAAPSQPQSEYVKYILKNNTRDNFVKKTLFNFDINYVNGQEGSIGCDCHQEH
jgi:hypothetical protein